MGADSKIEWTHHTWNLWRGCTEVSPACDHCYARELAKRNPAVLGQWGKGAPRVLAAEAYRKLPLKWNAQAKAAGERRRVFALSMGDWLDDEVPAAWLADLLTMIRETPNLDWLLLTKRPENWRQRVNAARDYFDGYMDLDNWLAGGTAAFPNVWIGTTVEDQARADERIPELVRIPARVRFLSSEPLLGPVDIEDYIDDICDGGYLLGSAPVHWVICGGESGHHARPMHPEWARGLRDQCTAAAVPFFFKQWGEYEPATLQVCEAPMRFVERDGTDSSDWTLDRHGPETAMMCRTGKKAAGRKLDGREWSEFPTFTGL